MSIEGKKKAQYNMALEIASKIVKFHTSVIDVHPLVVATQNAALEAQCYSMTNAIINTPHEYFNRDGKIDRRKVKRYKSRMGFSNKNTYLVRPNVKPCTPQ